MQTSKLNSLEPKQKKAPKSTVNRTPIDEAHGATNKVNRAKRAARRKLKNAGKGHKRKGPSYQRRQEWRKGPRQMGTLQMEPKAVASAPVSPVAGVLDSLPVP